MLAGYLGGCRPAQFRVWPDGVIIVPLGGQHEPDIGNTHEQDLVEQPVAQPSGLAYVLASEGA